MTQPSTHLRFTPHQGAEAGICAVFFADPLDDNRLSRMLTPMGTKDLGHPARADFFNKDEIIKSKLIDC